jgi:hypothetical protein
MSARQTNTSSNQQNKNKGPRLCQASPLQLVTAAIEKFRSLQHTATHDSQVGFPNALAEHILELVTSSSPSIATTLQNLCKFASQTNLNSGIYRLISRWESSNNTNVPTNVFKFKYVRSDDGQSDEESFDRVENDEFSEELSKAYFSPSTGDGCFLANAHFNNIIRMLAKKLGTLYETVIFKDVKPENRKVTEHRLREKMFDADSGKPYWVRIGNNPDEHPSTNNDHSLQAMTFVTLCTQYLEATKNINFKELAAHLQTLLRPAALQEQFVNACKTFNTQQRDLSRQTTLSSAVETADVNKVLEQLSNMPLPPPRGAQQSTVWLNRAKASVPNTSSVVSEVQQQTQPSSVHAEEDDGEEWTTSTKTGRQNQRRE